MLRRVSDSRVRVCLLPVALVCIAGIALFDITNRIYLQSALNTAVRHGELGAIERLLDQGADVNREGGMRAMPPLMAAAESGQMESLRLLLKRGADVSGHNASANALMFAAHRGDTAMVRLLLARGADVDFTASSGATAESVALEAGSLGVVDLIRGHRTHRRTR